MDPSQVTGFDRRALLRKGVGAAALGDRPPARRQLASVAVAAGTYRGSSRRLLAGAGWSWDRYWKSALAFR